MNTKELQKKWKFYEKRWRFRDFYFNKCLRMHGIVKYFHREPVMPHYAHKWVMSSKKTNDYLYDKVMSGKPFFAYRFGNTELQTMVGELKDRITGYSDANEAHTDRWFNRLCEGAGFFPNDRKYLAPFTDCMLETCKQMDLLAMWHLNMEDFVIEEYASHVDLTFLFRLEPWLYNGRPWTSALKGKKVLIIHPFVETIRSQYEKNREQIFPGTDILPEFELKTLKAVQTIAGEKDERFATQLLFGIKGRRWEENYPSKIATWFNEAWVYPSESETPKNAGVVEKGCYWK